MLRQTARYSAKGPIERAIDLRNHSSKNYEVTKLLREGKDGVGKVSLRTKPVTGYLRNLRLDLLTISGVRTLLAQYGLRSKKQFFQKIHLSAAFVLRFPANFEESVESSNVLILLIGTTFWDPGKLYSVKRSGRII
jgi:hypothetical protein